MKKISMFITSTIELQLTFANEYLIGQKMVQQNYGWSSAKDIFYKKG